MLRHLAQGHAAVMWGTGMPAWLSASEAHALCLLGTRSLRKGPGDAWLLWGVLGARSLHRMGVLSLLLRAGLAAFRLHRSLGVGLPGLPAGNNGADIATPDFGICSTPWGSPGQCKAAWGGGALKRFCGPHPHLYSSKAGMGVHSLRFQMNSAMAHCVTLGVLLALSEPPLPEAGH